MHEEGKEGAMCRMTRWLVLVVCALSVALNSAAYGVDLKWWSHWAIEDNKKFVLFEVKKRFEAKHPGNTVTITFYEKVNMFPVLRAAFTAGSGFPDVFYYEADVPEFIPAGWLADMSTGIRWENMEPSAKAFWTRPGPGGKMSPWAIAVESASDELYYNKKMFQQLGITVPANGVFTQDQFKEVVGKCVKSGVAAFATGTSDREYPALYIPSELLLGKIGGDEVKKLVRGELSWKDPRVVEVFRYYKELVDMGAYSKAMTSMTLAESHRYFHTDQKACMFPVSSWYTGRSFVPPEKGGQPKDFELGMLNYPMMKDGKGANQKYIGYQGSLAVAAKGPNLALAMEVANTFADPEIGNLWTGKTGIQTGIKTDVPKIDSPIKWYIDMFHQANRNTKWQDIAVQTFKLNMKPEMWEVWVSILNQGLPNKLIGADEALDKLEAARLKFK
jgi:multiple sugar transport system substrate-binding protein